MEKLLCIVGGMNTGGAETFLMKLYRTLPLEKYQMDFCVTNPQKGFYDDEILRMGGKIIHIPKKTKNPISNFMNIVKIVKKGKYKNVIRISQHSLSAIDLLAAKIGGAKNLIFRSSNSNSCGNKTNALIHEIFKPLAVIIPNKKIAPSDTAAIHMFGKRSYEKGKVILLNNGVPLEKFRYNKEIRQKLRRKLKIEDKFVIGHIGRFTEQKNHKFLLDVFKEYLKINSHSILMLIGDGPLKDDVINYAQKIEVQDKIMYLGLRNDTNELYQCMDCFVFPSLYEGMPNTVIEAQTSGLRCVISDTITKDVKLTTRVDFCSLKDIKDWINKITESKDREETYKQIKEQGYDIQDVGKKFISIAYN